MRAKEEGLVAELKEYTQKSPKDIFIPEKSSDLQQITQSR